ncbi:MAG: hypothetical protein IJK42_05220 [Prevotella sp.]|nr:hypothetical protein [Prevotella sp.]
MTTRIIYLAILVTLTACGTKQQTEMEKPTIERRNIGEFTPNTLLIMYDKEVGKEPLVKAIKAYKAEIIYDYGKVTGFAIRIPEGKKIDDAILYFKKVEGVKSVECDRIYHIDDPIGPRRRSMDKVPLIKPE